MKKTLIAGAASLALAAMPVLGVFATSDQSGTTVTDNLEVTIETACSFLRYGEKGTANQSADITVDPDWDGPTTSGLADNDSTYQAADHTYSAAMLPGADVELGTSHFTAYCNVPSGFSVTVITPALTAANGTDTIAYSGSASPSEGWTITKKNDVLFNNANPGTTVFMSANGSTDASSAVEEDATYNVYTTSTTEAGVYKSEVVYTFTYTDPTATNP